MQNRRHYGPSRHLVISFLTVAYLTDSHIGARYKMTLSANNHFWCSLIQLLTL